MYHAILAIFDAQYLATGASFRSLAFSFRMSHTTIRQVVYETCEAIWNTLYQKHMPFPTESMFSSIAEQFYRKLELNVLRNLGLVDAQYKFICVEVGSYGKQSDGGIFTTSSLYHHLEQNTFCVPGPKTVPGTNIIVPHVFVGDAAYPLKQYLMRPFSGHNLSQEQENFNYCLSRARRLVECAFGIITSKWRILKTEIELAPDKVDLIVKCICLLHNIIIDLEGNPHIIKDIVKDLAHYTNTTQHSTSRQMSVKIKCIRLNKDPLTCPTRHDTASADVGRIFIAQP
ncbi:hypothetical protein PPYR_04550 [Photinus pyralis]|uniref:DDE Tnp4 domain-containing protein n=1 Tax=Photinus pyralis TaxID=7054 RepID=A0A5N4AYE9_PHOPY|nr:hypothetical protein PPYR_04550 [Photinus pyralis]